MKNRVLRFLMVLTFGIVIGVVLALSLGAIISYIDPGTLLSHHQKKFGDIRLWAFEPNDIEENEDVGEIMMISKNNIPFFYAEANKSGKVTNLAILGKEKSIRLSIIASTNADRWKMAIYGCTKDDQIVGEQYLDLNFDGQFDAKDFYDDNGTLISQHIYLDKAWQKVERLEKGKAILDQKTYVFSDDSGWTIKQ